MKIGQLVRIIDWGKYYPNYKDMAKELKATKWKANGGEKILKSKPTGVIVNVQSSIYLVDIYRDTRNFNIRRWVKKNILFTHIKRNYRPRNNKTKGEKIMKQKKITTKDVKELNAIMGMKGMYFDMQGKPIGLGDWIKLLESKRRIIKQTKIGEYLVSTVWIGLSNIVGKPSGIFETMVFDKTGMGISREQYNTLKKATESHKIIVKRMKTM
jgi:hypothetical protein